MLIQPACLVGMSSTRPGVCSAVHMVVHMTCRALTSMHSDHVCLHGVCICGVSVSACNGVCGTDLLDPRYAGGTQSRAAASGLKLVAKAKANKPATKPKPAVPTISPEEEARQRRAKQLEQQARDRKAAEAAAKEKDAQRKWILQYAEDDSESDSDDGQQEQVSHEHRSASSCQHALVVFSMLVPCSHTVKHNNLQLAVL